MILCGYFRKCDTVWVRETLAIPGNREEGAVFLIDSVMAAVHVIVSDGILDAPFCEVPAAECARPVDDVHIEPLFAIHVFLMEWYLSGHGIPDPLEDLWTAEWCGAGRVVLVCIAAAVVAPPLIGLLARPSVQGEATHGDSGNEVCVVPVEFEMRMVEHGKCVLILVCDVVANLLFFGSHWAYSPKIKVLHCFMFFSETV